MTVDVNMEAWRSAFVRIPAGWFWMGSEGFFSWESPRRRVWTDEFEMAAWAVTREQFAAFIRDTGHAEPAGWNDLRFSRSTQPVAGVNWNDAVAFCEWLSRRSGDAVGLPTEAEWEKACRGGLPDALYAWGNEPPGSIDYFGGVWDGPKPQGAWRPNGYGLWNIGDNVHEWCGDWYSDNYYSIAPDRNPPGPPEGTRRVSRGGSWRHQIKASRAAHRSSLPPQYRYTDYGFRIVRRYTARHGPV